MSRTSATVISWLLLATLARAEIIVQLVPDNPGPYTGGETVTVDIWLQSEVDYYAEFEFVQFDFRDSDPGLGLATTIVFDYSALPEDHGYVEGTRQGMTFIDGPPLLPVPYTANGWAVFCPPPCPFFWFSIEPYGQFHIGSVQVQLPTSAGFYSLDLMNADDAASYSGAILEFQEGAEPAPTWRASTGEITGGTFQFVLTGPIPATSPATLVLLGVFICVGAGLIVRRRARGMVRLVILPMLLTSGWIATDAAAQSEEAICTETLEISLDSGYVSATGSGSSPVLIFSDSVLLTSKNWIRLHFGSVELSGSGTYGSFLRLVSVLDDEEQIMNAADLDAWGSGSGYFAGDEVLVELWAYPGTGQNRVIVDWALTDAECELHEEGVTGICGTDDRVFSDDPRVARIFWAATGACGTIIPGSGYLFENHPNALITAKHICSFSFTCPFKPIVEFNVAELPGVPPAPIGSQFPVEEASVIKGDNPGEDWCILGFSPNALDVSALQLQGSSFRLASRVPAPNDRTLWVTGYPYGQRQHTGAGEHLPPGPNDSDYIMRYDADMGVGQSGGPVHAKCGLALGINVTRACGEGHSGNIGIKVDFDEFQDALLPNVIDNLTRQLSGWAADCDGDFIPDWCEVGCSYPYGSCEQPCATSEDCNGNLVPDECEPDTDWNNNSNQDICDIAAGTAPDCNFNFVIDGKDIADGFSLDANQNGVPDECVPVYDCNQNGREDICDIAILENCDQNSNAIPDDCELLYVKGACCIGDECVQLLTECTCILRGGVYAGGNCTP